MLRRKQNKMTQSQLGEILGVTQSVISRMESMHYDIDDIQYSLLVGHFGATEVAKYVKEKDKEDFSAQKEVKAEEIIHDPLYTLSKTVAMQSKIIEEQAKTIVKLQETIVFLNGLNNNTIT